MEYQELLDQLQQLQRSLQDIEAARQMVNNTVEAYNGVSTRIELYSNQLYSVSDRIGQLITLISQNRDALSSNIDARMDAALEKAEQTSDHFSLKTSTALATFERDTEEQIKELNSVVTSIVNEAQRAISQATEAASELQTQSIIALENASSSIPTSVEDIHDKLKQQFIVLNIAVNKRITICTVILAALLLCLLVVNLFH